MNENQIYKDAQFQMLMQQNPEVALSMVLGGNYSIFRDCKVLTSKQFIIQFDKMMKDGFDMFAYDVALDESQEYTVEHLIIDMKAYNATTEGYLDNLENDYHRLSKIFVGLEGKIKDLIKKGKKKEDKEVVSNIQEYMKVRNSLDNMLKEIENLEKKIIMLNRYIKRIETILWLETTKTHYFTKKGIQHISMLHENNPQLMLTSTQKVMKGGISEQFDVEPEQDDEEQSDAEGEDESDGNGENTGTNNESDTDDGEHQDQNPDATSDENGNITNGKAKINKEHLTRFIEKNL